ncbi:UDP-N-acetylmuramoyl-L-alanine--D-glutamate ligase [Actinomyces sp. B33]|uniref:UDP-N-acetylmuramoyl-L-alanine--D-glutamate ligase n=1 Tax=Actinomyces sp. B33 TaxID=2942131 RepID=UPI002341E14A|nr:UDP-N-acetylmuramoyl-L-alanine--D-glutamate ligase [Actinomyces sp. B33]MDC4233080.1 UDP-N-acetylmuramoyl-L-alanine--D-glutamate ligase [Actinomyces sp. B33]
MTGPVAVIGWGSSGRSAARALVDRGREVVAFDSREPSGPADAAIASVPVVVEPDAERMADLVVEAAPNLVVVSPGVPARSPVFARCAAAGIDVWGEVELAWRLQEDGPHAGRPWLVVTGTNGKTTTVGMLGSILRAAGEEVLEVGNIGTPITRAIDSDASVFAVELSSFQLHTCRTVSPRASVCLNVDADHLDWHSTVEAYAADKARVYENTRVACVYPAHDRRVEAMVEGADVVEGARAIGIALDAPAVSMLGVVEGMIVDRAFIEDRRTSALRLADLTDLEGAYGPRPTPAVVMDALAAAALARAHGVAPEAVEEGLRAFRPSGHRRAVVARAADLTWIDDSKATNAHAAAASLAGIPDATAVWIFGGDAKGQDFTGLVERVAPRLRGVVVIGEDRAPQLAALASGAPRVPVVEVDGHEDWMFSVVNEAVALSRPGDTVVLAPACASWDQFDDYGQRGDAFADAVRRLAEQWGEPHAPA